MDANKLDWDEENAEKVAAAAGIKLGGAMITVGLQCSE